MKFFPHIFSQFVSFHQTTFAQHQTRCGTIAQLVLIELHVPKKWLSSNQPVTILQVQLVCVHVCPTFVWTKKEIVFTRMTALLHVSSILRGLNGVPALSHAVVVVRRQDLEFVSVDLLVMVQLLKHSLASVVTNLVQLLSNAVILPTPVKAWGHIGQVKVILI